MENKEEKRILWLELFVGIGLLIALLLTTTVRDVGTYFTGVFSGAMIEFVVWAFGAVFDESGATKK